jgi:hypothetical protein
VTPSHHDLLGDLAFKSNSLDLRQSRKGTMTLRSSLSNIKTTVDEASQEKRHCPILSLTGRVLDMQLQLERIAVVFSRDQGMW